MYNILALFVILSGAEAILRPEEAAKLTGGALVDYLKKHQTLFQVDESQKARTYSKLLMSKKYHEILEDEKRVKIQLDEEPPESSLRIL
ncbi:unnamed protein product [Strongylus vulgaris]|uniref:Uncharacterized protein n=1 Tax=Strongylus vulgaris TaxID=40348 RepID=A0A3P7LEY6_STRVU|nr:unnamed protein product [Strongylus vulgaris]